MSIHNLPRLENYWSSDPILGVPTISNVMTSKRFKILTQMLHCNDNRNNTAKSDPTHDKLFKIRPVLDTLNQNVKNAYKSSNAISIDESMVPFKGRSSLKQYMPMKPVKRGYKVWCAADSKTGYLLAFDVYTGKSKNSNEGGTGTCSTIEKLGLGEKVVVNLLTEVNQYPIVVAFDNFFTTYRLLKLLKSREIYACGTVRSDRKGLPNTLAPKQNSSLERGEFKYSSKNGISAITWMDSKPVNFLSSFHNPLNVTEVTRKNKDGSKTVVGCPEVVSDYNNMMGGVDLYDQYRERYAVGRRSIKWWHRLFDYFLDVAIVNSHILWKLSNSRAKCDQLQYRIGLAKQLINGFSSRKRRGRHPVYLGHKREVPKDVRLVNVGSHMPEKSTKRRCRNCSTRAVEKRTMFICSTCRVPLCVPNCFKTFHK